MRGRGAEGEGPGMPRSGETVGGAGAAHRHEHAPRRRAGEQKLETATLVPPVARGGAVLALDPQRLQAERARERGGSGPGGGGPLPQTPGRERRAYLSGQSPRIGHCQPSAGGSACSSPPTTSATPRGRPASVRVTRWGALPSRRTPSSTRRWRRPSRRSPPAWSSWASRKSEPRRTPSCIATSGRPKRWRRASPRSGGSRWSRLTRRRRASTGIVTAFSSFSSPVATAAQRGPAVRAAVRDRLTQLGRLAWAEEEFAPLESLRWTGAPDSGDAFQRVKGARALAPRSLAALRELYGWREGLAAEQDKATFRIIRDDALPAVAQALPRSPAGIAPRPQL